MSDSPEAHPDPEHPPEAPLPSEQELDAPRDEDSVPLQGDERIASLEQQCSDLKDRVLRGTAELENFRRRSAREIGQARQRGVADLAGSLLEVLDNLERALDSVSDADSGGLAEGVRMVHSQLLDRLRSFEIERLQPEGQAFDPHFHEALLQEERDDVAPGTVLQELSPGYRLGDSLLRAAKVRVARAPAAQEGDAAGSDAES